MSVITKDFGNISTGSGYTYYPRRGPFNNGPMGPDVWYYNDELWTPASTGVSVKKLITRAALGIPSWARINSTEISWGDGVPNVGYNMYNPVWKLFADNVEIYNKPTSPKPLSLAGNPTEFWFTFHCDRGTEYADSGYSSIGFTNVTLEIDYTGTPCVAPVKVGLGVSNQRTLIVGKSQPVNLLWSEADNGDNEGYNTITGYEVWRSNTVDGTYTLFKTINTTEKNSSTNVISPETVGDSYFYKIVTLGSKGEGSNSQRSEVVQLRTYYTIPLAPTEVSIPEGDVLLSSENILSWNEGVAGVTNPIAGYKIYRSSAPDGAYTFLDAVELVSQTTVVASDLLNTTYYYKVETLGTIPEYINSGMSTAYATLKTIDYTPVTLPTVFYADPAVPDAGVTFPLKWSGALPGQNNEIVKYEIYRANTANGTYALIGNSTTLTFETEAHETMGSSYFYKLIVKGLHSDSALSSAIKVTSQTYAIPNVPIGISLGKSFTLVPNEDISLSWNKPSGGTNNPVTGYKIYRSTTANGTYTQVGSAITNPNTLSAVVKSTNTRGSFYYYKVTSTGTKEGFLESEKSVAVGIETSLYTYCTPPTNLKLNGETSDLIVEEQATLTWTASSAGANNPVSFYLIEEKVFKNDNTLVTDWSSAKNMSGVLAHNTTGITFTVYPPEMGRYKKFRVKAVGTQVTYSSDFTELTPKLFRKIIVACGAPTFNAVPSIAELSFTLSWKDATAGTNNAITGYGIQYKTASPGSSVWSAWSTEVVVPNTATSGSYLAVVAPTRGDYIVYRIRTLGFEGINFYSPYAEAPAVKSNQLPLTPVINFPKNATTFLGKKFYLSVNLPTEPDGHGQKIKYTLTQSGSVKFSGISDTFLTAGKQMIMIDTADTLANGAVVLKVSLLDIILGESPVVTINLTKQNLTWIRNISTSSVIDGHVADINELVARVNSLRPFYGLPVLTLSTEVGYFANWYPQMIEIRNSLGVVLDTLNITKPKWIVSAHNGYPNSAIFNQIKTTISSITV